MRKSGLSNLNLLLSKMNWISSELPTHSSTTETMHATPPIRLPSVICFSALRPASCSSDAVRLITSVREMQLSSPGSLHARELEQALGHVGRDLVLFFGSKTFFHTVKG